MGDRFVAVSRIPFYTMRCWRRSQERLLLWVIEAIYHSSREERANVLG